MIDLNSYDDIIKDFENNIRKNFNIMASSSKFRAFDKSNKIMHYDFQYIKSGNEGNDWIIFTSDKQRLDSKIHPFTNPYFQQQFDIMEFSGIIDKNGKKIYEKDIVKGFSKELNIYGCSEVFKDKFWQPFSFLNSYDGNIFEVVGNLHEEFQYPFNKIYQYFIGEF